MKVYCRLLCGMAGCSADCETMWQIGVDVLLEYRRRNIESALTSRLALKMPASYYSRGCDSRELFAGRKIESDSTYEEHLKRYDVVFLNMQQFLIGAAPGKASDKLLGDAGSVARNLTGPIQLYNR